MSDYGAYETVLPKEPTAANIGIARARWCAVDATDASPDRAAEVMRSERFDMLPIASRGQPVREYFVTRHAGTYAANAIDRRVIRNDDLLAEDAPMRELIQRLAMLEASRRHLFFFLHAPGRAGIEAISGLVTSSNLNCRMVRNHLYASISHIEARVAASLRRAMSPSAVVDRWRALEARHPFEKDKDVSSAGWRQFQRDSNAKREGDPVEYMELRVLLELWAGAGAAPIDAQMREAAVRLRNRVFHPVKPVLGPRSGDRGPIAVLSEQLNAVAALESTVASIATE